MVRLLLPLLILIISSCTQPSRNPQDLIPKLYTGFKKHFITDEGRVRRPSDNDNTVSEGQAYAMIIAAAMDDKKTFDLCFLWAEQNLSRKEKFWDHLLAWKWEEGKVQDWTPASDADLDYTYALLLAYEKWGDETYKQKAGEVALSILIEETILSPYGHLLLPGTWGMEGFAIVQNPSYFSPAWYRKFAKAFDDARWLDLIDPGYKMLDSLQSKNVGLVPDWCLLVANGDYVLPSHLQKAYWWDAFRTPWRLFLDWKHNKDPRALKSLKQFHDFYSKDWKDRGYIAEKYTFNGAAVIDSENSLSYMPVMLAAYANNDPLWEKAYARLMQHLDAENEEFLVSPEEYYVNSWVLLGLLALTAL